MSTLTDDAGRARDFGEAIVGPVDVADCHDALDTVKFAARRFRRLGGG
jgi:hypothetical protein